MSGGWLEEILDEFMSDLARDGHVTPDSAREPHWSSFGWIETEAGPEWGLL